MRRILYVRLRIKRVWGSPRGGLELGLGRKNSWVAIGARRLWGTIRGRRIRNKAGLKLRIGLGLMRELARSSVR